MAATGRITVAPGQTVASSWGNTVFDQSVMCFASAADRDNQYPSAARHPGAIVYVEDVKQLQVWDGAAWRQVPVAADCYFRMVRTTTMTFPADGQQIGVWETEEVDAQGVATPNTNGGYVTAPRSGRMWFAGRVCFSVGTGASTGVDLFTTVRSSTNGGTSWGAEIVRGGANAWTATGYRANADIGVTFGATVAVTAGTAYSLHPFVNAPGAVKSCFGGSHLTYFEGWYVQ